MNDLEKVVNNSWDISAPRSFVEAMLSQWRVPGAAIAPINEAKLISTTSRLTTPL